MNVLLFTPPGDDTYVRLGRCGGKSKGGEKWPPVKLLFTAGAVRERARVLFLDAESSMAPDDFMDSVVRFTPDLLVFEPTPGSLTQDQLYIRRIKNLFPHCRAIALGGFATPLAAEILKGSDAIDFIVAGEPEVPLRNFIDQKGRGKIEGIWRKENGAPAFAGNESCLPNLDDLPFPAHDLLVKKAYRSPVSARRYFTVTESSRGCPYRCLFCNAHLMNGKIPRFRSIRNLMEEFAFIRQCGFREIKFNDETFTLSKTRTIELSEAMIRGNLGLAWKCNTRADCIDEETLRWMKKAGCHTIFIGAETANAALLRYYRKDLSPEQVEQAVQAAKKAGIKTVLHFMFGAPEESVESIRETIKFACKTGPDFIGFNILTPYPGTELFDDLKKDNYILNTNWTLFDQSGGAGIRTKYLSSRDLEHAVTKAAGSFYFRPAYVFQQLKNMTDPGRFFRHVSGFLALWKTRKRSDHE